MDEPAGAVHEYVSPVGVTPRLIALEPHVTTPEVEGVMPVGGFVLNNAEAVA
jgi:hypothetical protein